MDYNLVYFFIASSLLFYALLEENFGPFTIEKSKSIISHVTDFSTNLFIPDISIEFYDLERLQDQDEAKKQAQIVKKNQELFFGRYTETAMVTLDPIAKDFVLQTPKLIPIDMVSHAIGQSFLVATEVITILPIKLRLTLNGLIYLNDRKFNDINGFLI